MALVDPRDSLLTTLGKLVLFERNVSLFLKRKMESIGFLLMPEWRLTKPKEAVD